MATTSRAARQLSDGNSQGTILGQSTSDVIGFYGVTTAVNQRSVTITASSAQSTTDAAAMSTPSQAVTVWGYTSAAQANSIVTGLNATIVDVAAIRTALRQLGLLA